MEAALGLAACDVSGRPHQDPDEDGASKGAAPVVLIVEEKPICRLAISSLASEVAGLGEGGLAASMAEALQFAENNRIDLLLVDLFSIGFDFEALRRLITATRAPTIVIDDRPNPRFAALAQTVGARGYASKTYELDRFRAVIRAVAEGGAHFPHDPAGQPRLAPTSRAVGLSPRQMDVLKCIAVGMSNQQIASSLGITLGTVKLHIHAILRLTGTRNRTEAALIAGRFLTPVNEG